jgi:class 3 adenylate cyclase/tetratricopeptide (TPR) repeat protein
MQKEAVSSEIRTFLIADVRGYTRFTLENGDAAAARLASRFAGLVREVVLAHGGDVVELRGDEALAVFASTRQSLWAAVALQDRFAAAEVDDPELPLPVGIGIDAGEAIPVVEGGYRGAALNLAARLCSIATPGEVLCSESVVHLARKLEGLEYRHRSMVMLKGFVDPVAVVQVVRSGAPRAPGHAATQETPSSLEQALPVGGFLGSLARGTLVARERELEPVLASIDRAAESTGQTVLLAGEPGAGKTRLAQEATFHLHERGFLVAAGRCYEPEQAVPYYPFLDVLSTAYAFTPAEIRLGAAHRWPYLGALLPDQIDVPEGAMGQDDQQRVFRAVTSFLETVSSTRPVALLLDDLHWADSSSLKLLLHLARHTIELPIYILGTYRDVEVGRQHPLQGALRDLNREGIVTRIDIKRLPEEGTAELVSTTMGGAKVSDDFARLVHRRTEGNPYFVEQVLRVLIEQGDIYRQDGHWTRRAIEEIEVPESVRSVVGNRLSRLHEDHQEVLRQASVLGQTFSFDDLVSMGDHSEADLEDALEATGAAGLTRTTGGEVYAFDHALTQQSLYEELSPRRRRRLHLAAGAALEALSDREREQRVAELAWHFLQGDDTERALLYSLRAGDEAEAVFAHGDAESHYRTALELARDSGDTRHEADALQKLGGALRLSGRYAEAHELLERAAVLYRQLDDREGELGVVAQLGRLHAVQGTSDEGIKRLLPVVEELEREGVETLSSTCTAGLYVSLAGLYFRGGKWQDLVHVSDEAVRLSESAGNDRLVAEAEGERGRALSLLGRAEDARRALNRAINLARSTGDFLTLRNSLNSVAFLQRRAGDLRGAADSYRQALEQSERLGDPGDIAFARFVLGRVYVEQGKWREAREQFEHALSAAQSADTSWYSSYAMAGLGYLHLLEGEHDEGLRHLTEAVAIAEQNEDIQGLRIHGYLAVQEILDGRSSDAIARMERLQTLTRSAGRETYLWQLTWALLEAGFEDQAVAVSNDVGDHMLFEGRVERPDVLRVHAMVAIRQGRWEDATQCLEEGLALTREIGMPFHEALLMQERGRMHEARGDTASARQTLKQSLDLYRQLGAAPYAQRVEDMLTRLK